MSDVTLPRGPRKGKIVVWFSIGVGLMVLTAANLHMLYAAVSSEPNCVAHLRQGERNGMNSFSAAESSCTITQP